MITKNICSYCVDEFRSHGEKIYIGERVKTKCFYCGERDDVYECIESKVDVFTDKRKRCRDCGYLVEDECGTWICDDCGKNIHDVPDDECSANQDW